MLFSLLFPTTLAADDNKTLQDLIDELNETKAELKRVNEEQALTEAQIRSIQANIANITRELMIIDQNIEKLIAEIKQLNLDIVAKDEEMKRVINQHQLSNGNNAYLEYVMGAATVTDFIFRLAIVEQMTEHNQNLIDTMNELIVESERKTENLEKEKVSAKQKRSALYNEQFKLGNRTQELNEYQVTLEDEISDAIKTIDNYRRYFNCQPHQRLRDCTAFPVDANFVRPLARGVVTSEFGWRTIFNRTSFHAGIDIGGNSVGTNVHAAANGRVVFISYNLCMEHYLVIQHNVNGKYYATRYIHLNRVDVRVGQEVRRETVIGGVGGANPNRDPRICSTGPHLHFEIAEGIYGQDFTSFTRTGPIINPRNLLNFPARGVWFYGRF